VDPPDFSLAFDPSGAWEDENVKLAMRLIHARRGGRFVEEFETIYREIAADAPSEGMMHTRLFGIIFGLTRAASVLALLYLTASPVPQDVQDVLARVEISLRAEEE
jgi:hypothetical protein